MTISEFSDTFTTLLNSYANQGLFGEGASKTEIVLDEYEKSVFLTLAQDLIVKTYFDARLNQHGEGFDDGTRRQVDFSSLIKVVKLKAIPSNNESVDIVDGDATIGSVVITNESGKDVSLSLHHLSVLTKIAGSTPASSGIAVVPADEDGKIVDVYFSEKYYVDSLATQIADSDITGFTLPQFFEVLEDNLPGFTFVLKDVSDSLTINDLGLITIKTSKPLSGGGMTFDDRGIIYKLPTDALFILNESLNLGDKRYVIVPLNYREYDREMSKPYAQPLKKQAWRLFQNVVTGFDMYSELIPIFNIVDQQGEFIYKLRYVRRPRPIILEDLPNHLEIDGERIATDCELNPSLHMDVLDMAVKLAIQSRVPQSRSTSASNKEEQ